MCLIWCLNTIVYTWNEFYEIAQITSSINWFGVCCAIFQIAINRCYEGDDDVNISNFSLNGNINNQFGQIFHDKNTHSIRNVAHKMFSILACIQRFNRVKRQRRMNETAYIRCIRNRRYRVVPSLSFNIIRLSILLHLSHGLTIFTFDFVCILDVI